MKKIHWILFACLTGLFMFMFLDSLEYVITYLEQHHLFLFSRSYLHTYLHDIGKPGQYIANFVIQFFYLPYTGKILFSLILSLPYLFSIWICRRVTGKSDPLHLPLLPPLYLLTYYEAADTEVSHATGFFCCTLLLLLISFLKKRERYFALVLFVLTASIVFGWKYPVLSILIIATSSLSAHFLSLHTQNSKIGVIVSVLCFSLYAGGTFYSFVYSYNMKERLMLDAETNLKNKNWKQVLACANKYRGNNQLIEYYRNMALYHTGRMPSDLLKYPQTNGAASLFLPWTSDARQSNYGHYIYEQIGYTNEAHRWVFESMVVFGETAPILINLIRYNIVNKRPEVAMRFIRVLKQSLFYKKQAEELERLAPTGQVPGLKTLAGKEGAPARFANILNIGPELRFICEQDSSNQMAFEYLMSYLLLSNQLIRFAENLPKIQAFSYPQMPRLYEEALYVYKVGVSEEAFRQTGFRISPDTEKRFQAYYTLHQTGKTQQLEEQFGDTYWFYLHYKSPYGSKAINK